MLKGLVIFLLLLLPVLFLLQDFKSEQTGLVVNDVAVLRLERLQLARAPFSGWVSAECRVLLRRIDQLLRFGADDRYYEPSGLVLPELFFVSERSLFNLVDQVSWSSCPDRTKGESRKLFDSLAGLDTRLVVMTVERSRCSDAVSSLNGARAALWRNDTALFVSFLEDAAVRAQC
ncbi:hypothetical protein HY489_05100 [Candidatus Woesearchaeota archaeon]|nr:hypothetical protein [Candidatus Woesearchaeota archaeon]